jgi:hypothetical protein
LKPNFLIEVLPMLAKLFAFPNPTLVVRSEPASAREVQAYYEAHADATAKLRTLKWFVAALLVFVGFAAWAGGNIYS